MHQLYCVPPVDANVRALAYCFMPIFDFVCRQCHHEFDALVRGADVPTCKGCGSADLEKLLSMPNVKSETTHGLAMRAARRRDRAAGTERMIEQRKYEESHDD